MPSERDIETRSVRGKVMEAASIEVLVRVWDRAPRCAEWPKGIPVLASNPHASYAPRTEQMLVCSTENVVDAEALSIDRQNSGGMCRVYQDAAPVGF